MALRIRSSRGIFTLVLLLLIVLNISPLLQSTSISTEENIESYSRFVVASASEYLSVNAFDSTYAIDPLLGWTGAGASPYLDAQDEATNIIYTKVTGSSVGWFDFPATTLTGTLTVNISVYCKNDDGAGNDWADVFVDYVGGGGADVGDIGQHTTYSYDTISLPAVDTVAEVNALRVYFQMIKFTAADEVYIDHVRLGVSGEEAGEGETYYIDANELIDISESQNTAVNWSAGINEIIDIAESLGTSVNWGVTVQEILDISDSLGTSVSWGVVVNEILEIYSSVVAEIVDDGIYSIIINELIEISDSLSTSVNWGVVVNELIEISEVNTKGVSLFIVLTEIVELFDSVNALINPADAIIINVIISIGDNEIIQGGLEGINIFYDLFLSNNMWGYLGVMGLVIIGYFLTKREKFLGVLWFVVECLFVAQYLPLVEAHPGYWWHIFILLLGGLFTCVYPLLDR